LQGVLRARDTISRLKADEPGQISRVGGDEFTVLLSSIANPQDVAIVAQRLMEVIRKPVTLNGHEVCPGGSIGIAIYPTDGEDGDTLLRNADIAMYRAKRGGGNGFEFYSEFKDVDDE
jgi:diguanylate cyclase (GGDEF)-like protein